MECKITPQKTLKKEFILNIVMTFLKIQVRVGLKRVFNVDFLKLVS